MTPSSRIADPFESTPPYTQGGKKGLRSRIDFFWEATIMSESDTVLRAKWSWCVSGIGLLRCAIHPFRLVNTSSLSGLRWELK